MSCPAVRLALLGFLLSSSLDLRAEAVSRTSPDVFNEKIAGLLTPIEQVLSTRDAFKETSSHGVKLLDEYVRFRDNDGIDYVVFHDVYLARTSEAKDVMANRIYTFDHERASIFLVTAATVNSNGERQPLDDRVAFIQTPQREAENGLYTSRQELNLIFPNIVPGSVTEAIVVIREDKPVFPGEFATLHTFSAGWPTVRSRFVADLPSGFAQQVGIFESSPKVPPKVVETEGNRTRWTWTRENIDDTKWEESAPALEFREPTVWLSSIDSWDRIAAWFSSLAEGREVLGPDLEKEVDRLTEGLTDRWSIVSKLCEAVSNEVRYTGLEFGLAGYQPHACSEVWANRYGDCKDKANLLRAMLARKGIAAKFVLLQTWKSGRVEQRSPSWKQFNHMILAIDDGVGGMRFCDPTARYLPAGLLASGDTGRSVLLIDGEKAEWSRTPDPLDSSSLYSADLTLSPSGGIEGWFTIHAEGADAAGDADYYGGFKPYDRQRSLQRTVEAIYPGAEVIDVDYKPATGSEKAFEIRAYILRNGGDDVVESLPFGFPPSWLPAADTPGERKFPYTATRRIQSFEATLKLPPGWNAVQPPADFKADSAAAHFEASWKTEANVVHANLRWHPEASEIPAADYALLQRSVRSLRTWLEKPIQIARGSAPKEAATAAVDDFPLLATGEGQMRLLAERYPMGKRDEDRRTALKQVIQWFPDDIDTTFSAKVFIAIIDFDDDNAGLAHRLGEILSDYGTRPPKESCAWAQYLRYRAQWWSSKDPAALESLKGMAADSTLSDYRRSWSAHYAARFLGESDPAAALDLVAEWDTEPIEAREAILKAEAGYLTAVAKTEVISAWAKRLIAAQPAEADSLIATMLGQIRATKEKQSFAVLAQFQEAISPLASDTTRFAKTNDLLADLGSAADDERRRSEFVAALSDWIENNPRPWITRGKSDKYADVASLEKQLNAMNDAHDGKAVVDASFQLARYHACDYATFAKYLFWAAWWLENQKFDPELLAQLSKLSHELPSKDNDDIGSIWLKYAKSEHDAGHFDEARAEYKTILALPGTKPFQRVEAAGELGSIELGLHNIPAAQAAFDIALKEHLTHKRGAEYLTVAAMLCVDLGQWGKARHILDEIARTEQEYLKKTLYADELGYLLASFAKPDALQQYWEKAQTWRIEWNKLLEKHGVPVAGSDQLALISDINGLQADLAKAAKEKDSARFLAKLDVLVRTAQVVPIYTMNFCSQTVAAAQVSPELHKDLMEFGLKVAREFPRFEDSVYWDTQIWVGAFLTDLGRAEEAGRSARELYFSDGPSDMVKSTALIIWLTSCQGTERASEPVEVATKLLGSGNPVKRRPEIVQRLSNALAASGSRSANIILLARELNHPDIVANSGVRKSLGDLLDGLRRENAASEALTGEINEWLGKRNLTALADMPPTSLSDQRYGNGGRTEIYDSPAYSQEEALKCNLLLALDESRPMDLRYRAFAAFVSATSYYVPKGDDCVQHVVSAAAIKSLPDNIRFEVLSQGLGLLSRTAFRGAAGVLDGASGPEQRDSLQKLYEGSLAIVETLQDYSPEKARDAFQKGTAEAMGPYETFLIRILLTRMVLEGDSETALNLINEATSLNIAASSGQSAAGVRLDWTRHVRRENTNLPFYNRIRDILVRHCAPADSDTETFRSLTWPLSVNYLGHEARAKAIAAAYEHNLFSMIEPVGVISMLSSARTFMATHDSLGMELETTVLTAAELDDATRAQWIDATDGLSDIDKPEILEVLGKAMNACLARTDPSIGPATKRAIRMKFAVMALRTSLEERPEALFGRPAIRDAGEAALRPMQLMFLCSRNQTQAALNLVDQIDADQLARSFLYPYAAALLKSKGDNADLDLLKSAARAGLKNDLPGIWLDATSGDIERKCSVAALLNDQDPVFGNAIARAESRMVERFDLEMIKMSRARMQGDWNEALRAATAVLEEIPDYYEALFYRGEALHHLGDDDAARPDLEIFMKKALNSDNRPIASQILGVRPE